MEQHDNIKATVWVVVFITVVLGGIYVLLPRPPGPPTPAAECFDLWKDRLKDPTTAELVDHFVTSADDSLMVKYRATNSFGAYVTGYFECPLDDEGQVDAMKTLDIRLDQLMGR